MFVNNQVLIGKNAEKELFILPDKANRHGLITGASGSGKTITLKVMAESFSSAGVPVFLSDIKGDLAGTCLPGATNAKIEERLKGINIDPESFKFQGFPTVFWDVYGTDGHPIRATVKSIGPIILSRMLGLSETQEGVLSIAFRIAEDKNMEIVDLKDLRLLLQYIGDNRKEYTISYGNISTQSVGGIQRSILMLEDQGGNNFFGEPAIDINDFIKTDASTGLGNINILHAVELFKQPNLYACFMLWLLTALNNSLPEVGDLEKPKIVFFFDEAHLLFDNIPSYMLTQITQVVKLIRSKGIGLFFISQTPNDIPGDIQAQLGNRVQHALRAYTPAEQKIVKAVASSFRANPSFQTESAIMELGTGEALISFANEKGEPNIVEKATILPPQSQMGAIDGGTRLMVMTRSPFKGKYDTAVDRETAYEQIKAELDEKQAEETAKREAEEKAKQEAAERKQKEQEEKQKEKEKKAKEKEAKKTKSGAQKVFDKAMNTATTTVTRKVVNSVLKNLFK